MVVIGAYNKNGYEVYALNDIGERDDLYSAGNNFFDSQQGGGDDCLPLEILKKYCEQTTKDIAEEKGWEYGGIEHDEIEEENGEMTVGKLIKELEKLPENIRIYASLDNVISDCNNTITGVWRRLDIGVAIINIEEN